MNLEIEQILEKVLDKVFPGVKYEKNVIPEWMKSDKHQVPPLFRYYPSLKVAFYLRSKFAGKYTKGEGYAGYICDVNHVKMFFITPDMIRVSKIESLLSTHYLHLYHNMTKKQRRAAQSARSLLVQKTYSDAVEKYLVKEQIPFTKNAHIKKNIQHLFDFVIHDYNICVDVIKDDILFYKQKNIKKQVCLARRYTYLIVGPSNVHNLSSIFCRIADMEDAKDKRGLTHFTKNNDFVKDKRRFSFYL